MKACTSCRSKSSGKMRKHRAKTLASKGVSSESPSLEKMEHVSTDKRWVFESYEEALSFLQHESEDSAFSQYVVVKAIDDTDTTYLACHMHRNPVGQPQTVIGDVSVCGEADTEHVSHQPDDASDFEDKEDTSDFEDTCDEDVDIDASGGIDLNRPVYKTARSLLTRTYISCRLYETSFFLHFILFF
jgi:hypothetical protein